MSTMPCTLTSTSCCCVWRAPDRSCLRSMKVIVISCVCLCMAAHSVHSYFDVPVVCSVRALYDCLMGTYKQRPCPENRHGEGRTGLFLCSSLLFAGLQRRSTDWRIGSRGSRRWEELLKYIFSKIYLQPFQKLCRGHFICSVFFKKYPAAVWNKQGFVWAHWSILLYILLILWSPGLCK